MKKIKYDNPIGAQIELTGRCNLKCHHCYNSSGDFGRFDIKDDAWLSFLKNSTKVTLFQQLILLVESLC